MYPDKVKSLLPPQNTAQPETFYSRYTTAIPIPIY